MTLLYSCEKIAEPRNEASMMIYMYFNSPPLGH